jgi:hypothetical protein
VGEEQFKVIARNGSVKFSSNRPLFRNKGIRKRIPDYILIEGIFPINLRKSNWCKLYRVMLKRIGKDKSLRVSLPECK